MDQEERAIIDGFFDAGAVLRTDEPHEKSDTYLRDENNYVAIPPDPLFGREVNPDLRAHFLLSSRPGSVEFHTPIFLLAPVAFSDFNLSSLIGRRLHDLIQADSALANPDILLGIPMGGIPVLYAVQHCFGRRGTRAMFFSRSTKDTLRLGRGFQIEPGQRAILTDDFISTGRICRQALDANGDFLPTGIALAIDRRPREKKTDFTLPQRAPTLKIVAAARFETEVYSQSSCPYCQKGHPLYQMY